MTANDVVPFLSSIAIGLLIGLERERSHPADTHQAAGSRTFALLALSGTLAATINTAVVVAGLAAVAALLVVGYVTTSTRDPGATTEVAAVVTFLLGALAWTQTGIAAALGIAVLVLLMSKRRIHTFAQNVITDSELEDATKFLVMAFVVLPLLPNRDVGPYGAFNPERIWQLVLALRPTWLHHHRGRFLADAATVAGARRRSSRAGSRRSRDHARNEQRNRRPCARRHDDFRRRADPDDRHPCPAVRAAASAHPGRRAHRRPPARPLGRRHRR
jgi:MgtC family